MDAASILKIADGYLERMEHAKYVSLLAGYLRGMNAEDSLEQSEESGYQSLTICFACGGSARRWRNFLGTPKHMVDIGKESPLIRHSIHQFQHATKAVSTVVLIDQNQRDYYSSITDADLIEREGDPDEDVAVEILRNHSLASKGEQDILLLMGDVAWSSQAIGRIAKHIKGERSLSVFGRSAKSRMYDNTGGEIFGAYIPYEDRDAIGKFYAACERLYHGNASFRMTRFSTWEVLALVTAAGRLSGKSIIGDIAAPGVACEVSRLHPLMKHSLENGDFLTTVWTEIDDETEDFDFPYEYLKWLRNQVSISIQKR